jgi:hypothetical protein
MAWTTPPVLTVGQVLTAATANIWSNDLLYLYNLDYYLSYANTAVSMTLVNGTFTVVETSLATINLTLPTPVAGGLVGVQNLGGNSTVVNVISNSGSIFGPGAPNIGSPLISIPLAVSTVPDGGAIVLISDGFNWYFVSGTLDSGWITPSLLNSWVAGSEPVGYRQIGNRVFLRGSINSGSNGTAAFTLPSPPFLRPVQAVTVPMVQGGGSVAYVQINTNGTVIPNMSIATSNGCILDGISFLMD